MFWSHAHNQKWPIIQRCTFDQSIDERDFPGFLFLAMCAAGVHFSCHPKVHQEQDGLTLGDHLYSMASQAVHPNVDSHPISRIHTFCILATCDYYQGRGKQASEKSSKYSRLSSVSIRVLL